MTRKEFEKIVVTALDQVPERFRAKMKNIAVLVEEGNADGELLGLYQGIPQTERGEGYGAVLPDTITLYMKPIVREAQTSGQAVEAVVEETLWHEIAHYFGMDEEGVHMREGAGTNRYK